MWAWSGGNEPHFRAVKKHKIIKNKHAAEIYQLIHYKWFFIVARLAGGMFARECKFSWWSCENERPKNRRKIFQIAFHPFPLRFHYSFAQDVHSAPFIRIKTLARNNTYKILVLKVPEMRGRFIVLSMENEISQ